MRTQNDKAAASSPALVAASFLSGTQLFSVEHFREQHGAQGRRELLELIERRDLRTCMLVLHSPLTPSIAVS
jgi:hypothetical protein